jgi:hypothetical protein
VVAFLCAVSDREHGASAAQPALIAEATKRAGVIWISASGHPPAPAWHIWHPPGAEGSAYVLTAPGEQPLPGLDSAEQATVLVPSKESGGLLVSWTADVSRIFPASPEWDQVVGLLVASRLNATGPSVVQAPCRWSSEGAVYRLTPAGQQ